MKTKSLVTLLALLVLVGAAHGATTQPADVAKKKKVTICHATASSTNPYVLIRVSKSGLKGHMHHPGDIIPTPKEGCPETPMTPTQGGIALTATLTGTAEVPGPGDTNGSGQATIRVTAGEGRLCFQLKATDITLPAAAAHVHVGTAAVAGDVVVPLTAPDATGNASGCVTVNRTLVTAILTNPGGYYVNIHTSDFPNGAIRGQLSA